MFQRENEVDCGPNRQREVCRLCEHEKEEREREHELDMFFALKRKATSKQARHRGFSSRRTALHANIIRLRLTYSVLMCD